MRRLVLLALGSALLLSGCDKQQQAEAEIVSPGAGSVDHSEAADAVSKYQERFKQVKKTGEGDVVVARIGDWELTLDDLDGRGDQRHLKRLKALYDTRFALLESILATQLYEMEGKREGMTGEELFKKRMSEVDTQPDLEALKNLKTDEARMLAMEEMVKQKMFTAHQNLIAELANKHGLEVLLAEPEVLVSAGDLDGAGEDEIVLGNADADLTIEIYTDFQCPFCKKLAGPTDQIYSRYADKAKFVFRPMVTNNHPASRPTAIGAVCAYQQGEAYFWNFHNTVFANQEGLAGGVAAVRGMAQQAGLKMFEYDSCFEDEDTRLVVDRASSHAFERGIDRTPSVFINGLPVVGAHPMATYVQIIEQNLQLAAQ